AEGPPQQFVGHRFPSHARHQAWNPDPVPDARKRVHVRQRTAPALRPWGGDEHLSAPDRLAERYRHDLVESPGRSRLHDCGTLVRVVKESTRINDDDSDRNPLLSLSRAPP